jgi:hypothetical protein
MAFRQRAAVYCDDHTRSINILFGVPNVKAGDMVTTVILRLNQDTPAGGPEPRPSVLYTEHRGLHKWKSNTRSRGKSSVHEYIRFNKNSLSVRNLFLCKYLKAYVL